MAHVSGDQAAQLISFLPERIWYLSQSGMDMWCRRPYSFFFTTSDAAAAFAAAVAGDMELVPVGVAAKELLSEDGLNALRMQQVTRIFLDPEIDPTSGDVYGKILRLAETN